MRFLLTLIGVLGLDQLVKLLVKLNMEINQSIPIIEPFLYCTYVQNRGAAFSLFPGATTFFIVGALVVIAGCFIYVLIMKPDKVFSLALGIIAGGAAGNLVDRILYQSVVDFIDLRFWPVFNLADCALCLGVGVVIWYTLADGRREEAVQWRR